MDESAQQPRQSSPKAKSGNKLMVIIISSILVVALVAVGILYVMEVGKLNDAKAKIVDLEGNVASLEGNVASLQAQLTTEKANVTSLQTQLAAEKDNVTKLTADLSGAQGQITTLQSELDASKARVTTLTTDLATAQSKVTTLEASLSKANADLTKATVDLVTMAATNDSLNAELRKLKDPRHFYSLTELQDWLQRDDTDTNPYLEPLRDSERAYILQIKALRDGYLLPAALDFYSQTLYCKNVAIVGGNIYRVDADTDQITLMCITAPFFSNPLPMCDRSYDDGSCHSPYPPYPEA